MTVENTAASMTVAINVHYVLYSNYTVTSPTKTSAFISKYKTNSHCSAYMRNWISLARNEVPLLHKLALWSTVVTIHTTCFYITKLCILPSECIYVFRIILTINGYCSPNSIKCLITVMEKKYFLWCMNRIFRLLKPRAVTYWCLQVQCLYPCNLPFKRIWENLCDVLSTGVYDFAIYLQARFLTFP